jgi:hypothetical protein
MTSMAMQQGGAGAAGGAIGPEVQREIEQAVAMAQAAAKQAEAAAQAQGQPGEAVVRIGEDGPLVIRDETGRETVIIDKGAIPEWLQDGPPNGAFMVPIAFFVSAAFIIVGWPLARAFARRMDTKHAAQAAVAPSAELRQLQNSIDTMALEIERMSEHQRFLTRVLSERTGESLPAARPGEPATRA